MVFARRSSINNMMVRPAIALLVVALVAGLPGRTSAGGFQLMIPPADLSDPASKALTREWRTYRSFDSAGACQGWLDAIQQEGERVLDGLRIAPDARPKLRNTNETQLRAQGLVLGRTGMLETITDMLILYHNMSAARCIAADDPRLR